MPHLSKTFTIKARDYLRAGEVSIQVQRLLKTIGFDPTLIRKVSICAYEAEMNVVIHGGDGVLRLTIEPRGILLDVQDEGPGIEDVSLALQEGYSTASEEAREMGFGAGMGLPNIKKNSDVLEITSAKGKGVHLRIVFDFEETS